MVQMLEVLHSAATRTVMYTGLVWRAGRLRALNPVSEHGYCMSCPDDLEDRSAQDGRSANPAWEACRSQN